jgi:hypothetical protein
VDEVPIAKRIGMGGLSGGTSQTGATVKKARFLRAFFVDADNQFVFLSLPDGERSPPAV